MRKEKGKGKEMREREREDFSALRRLRLGGPCTNVGTRIAICVWTPKTWCFDKLYKVGISPTWAPFHLTVVNGRMGQTRPYDSVFDHETVFRTF